VIISSQWTHLKRMILWNLTELCLAKFRQLAKLRTTFVWRFAWCLGALLRLGLLRVADLNVEPLPPQQVRPNIRELNDFPPRFRRWPWQLLRSVAQTR